MKPSIFSSESLRVNLCQHRPVPECMKLVLGHPVVYHLPSLLGLIEYILMHFWTHSLFFIYFRQSNDEILECDSCSVLVHEGMKLDLLLMAYVLHEKCFHMSYAHFFSPFFIVPMDVHWLCLPFPFMSLDFS